MAFNTSGSTAGNPTSGLLGNANNPIKLNFGSNSSTPPPIGNTGVQMSTTPSAGFINSFGQSTPIQQPPQNNTVKGIIQPIHPVSSTTTSPDGTTKQTFDTTAEPTPTPQTPPAPGTSFQGNLGGVVGSGAQTQNENQTQTGLINAGQETPAEQNAYKTAQDLTNEYANQEKAIQGSPIPLEFQQGRGQIVANQYGTQEQAAQTGIQNAVTAAGQGITAAQGAYSGAQNQANRATGAEESATGFTAPQQVAPTSGEYLPGQNTYGQNSGAPAGANGLGGVGILNSQIQAGNNLGTAAQAIGAATPVAQNLDNLINTNNINPTDLTFANGAINWAKANAGTPQQQAAITEFNGQLNDLTQKLAPVLGLASGAATTDFKAQLSQSIVNGLQNGQSIEQSVNYFLQQAKAGSLGAYTASQNPLGTLNNTSSDLYHF